MVNGSDVDRGRGYGADVAFLVGAGRSGTTLLYKVLCLHSRIAYISNYEERLRWVPDGLAARAVANHMSGKLDAWFNKGGNAYFIKRPWSKKCIPTPQEGEAVFRACGVPLYPSDDSRLDTSTVSRLRRRFDRIRRRSGAAIFLSKCTANNRRIRQLSEVFPEARYVHLLRDGREVAQSLSTVEWWDGHTVWWDGRTPREMEQSGEQRLAICARNWVREVEEIRRKLALIEPNKVMELRYEDLLREPVQRIKAIIEFLGLEFHEHFAAAVESLQMRPSTAKWKTQWNAAELDCVMHEIQPTLVDLEYSR